MIWSLEFSRVLRDILRIGRYDFLADDLVLPGEHAVLPVDFREVAVVRAPQAEPERLVELQLRHLLGGEHPSGPLFAGAGRVSYDDDPLIQHDHRGGPAE